MKKQFKKTLTQFVTILVLLVAFNCERESEIGDKTLNTQDTYVAPSITNAQQFFEQNSNYTGNLASRTETTSFTDWEVSTTKTYKQTEQLNVDILYTPIYINTQRTDVKAFIASTEHNGTVDARKLYVLYKSNDISNGLSAYIFVFNLDGHMELAYNFENGQEVPFPQQALGTGRTNCDGEVSNMSDTEFEE